MSVSENSKEYCGKAFPDYKSKLAETDPEFCELFDNFAFDEVVNSDDLDGKTRFTAISQCLPYIGYPRSLNALRCVNEAAKDDIK